MRFMGEGKQPTAVLVSHIQQSRRGIHVTLNEVTIEAPPQLRAPFKVDHTALLPLAQTRSLHGLLDGRYHVGIAIQLHDRQAHAIVRHALIDLQFACKRSGDGEVHVRSFVFHLFNPAVLLNDSCKHVIRLGVQHLPSGEVHR